MGKIRVLGEALANKIAAGEVVERPASVVKELVENSIDAGATQITITIEKGGKELIRVDDNGEGIAADDVLLALERHATSKLQTPEDLFAISTLGFRGEALPSIASVSQLTLITKTAEEAAGSLVEVHGGKIVRHEPTGTTQGTSIAVRQLFYNTPARYKFLKSDATERRYIVDTVTQIAMAHPDIKFGLVSDGQTLFQTPGDGDMLSVIYAAYGRQVAEAMLPVEQEKDFLHITGYISHPKVTRSNRKDEIIIINGRVINSRLLCNAVEKGYQSLLPARRFPVAIVSIDVDSSLIDVNVHPAKAEVRFQDDSQVYRAVLLSVRDTLLNHDLIATFESQTVPTGDTERTWIGSTSPAPIHSATSMHRAQIGSSDAEVDSPRRQPHVQDKPQYVREYEPNFELASSPGQIKTYLQNRDPELWSYDKVPEQPAKDPFPTELNPSVDGIGEHYSNPSLRLAAIPLFRNLVPLGQWLNTYILLAGNDALWIIDQHIAHERVLYEQLSKAYEEHSPARQPLLIPVQVELSPRESSILETNLSLLTRFGFTIEEFGGNTYLIREVPLIFANNLAEQDLTELIRELLEHWEKGGDKLDEVITSLACRGAIKAGDNLPWPVIEQILIQLAETTNPYTCPHGRPIIVKLTLAEVERRFGRR